MSTDHARNVGKFSEVSEPADFYFVCSLRRRQRGTTRTRHGRHTRRFISVMTYVSHHLLNRLRVACSIASRSLHEKSRLGAAIFEFFFRSSSDHINPHICTTDRGYVPARRFLCGTTTCFVTKTPSKFLRDRTYRFREITRIVSLKEKDKKDKKEEMKKKEKKSPVSSASQKERKKKQRKRKKDEN